MSSDANVQVAVWMDIASLGAVPELAMSLPDVFYSPHAEELPLIAQSLGNDYSCALSGVQPGREQGSGKHCQAYSDER